MAHFKKLKNDLKVEMIPFNLSEILLFTHRNSLIKIVFVYLLNS